MEFFFEGVKVPCEGELARRIDQAAQRLAARLRKLDVTTAGLSPYNTRYLTQYLRDLRPVLQMYAHVLAIGMSSSGHPARQSVFMDYGGGTGLLSLLAKEVGVGTVVYTDIYDVSCRDAALLGEAIGVKVDHFIEGDVESVENYMTQRELVCHIVACSDVLEHIYDLVAFFERLSRIVAEDGVMAFASNANGANPIVRRQLMARQRALERHDRPAEAGGKERDSRRAYINVRRDMVREHLPLLSPKQVDALARRTRGLIKEDIHRAVDIYAVDGKLPVLQARGSNTCDPLTGNWAEHLLSPRELRQVLSDARLQGQVLRGYYGSWAGAKAPLFPLVNRVISVLGPLGLHLAPFYTLVARRSALHRTDGVGPISCA